MKRQNDIALAVFLATAGLVGRAHAQPVPVATDTQTAPILRYGADHFAAQRPKTALDMINWLPGFTFAAGDASVRGFTGAAGNVVIDGERPADKDFTLSQVLQRIPAEQVDYIELIRGNAPGIDMLGQTMVANVVRKKAAADTRAVSISEAFFINGHHAPSFTLEGTHLGDDGRKFSGAVSLSRYREASSGAGGQTRRDAAGAVLQERTVNLSAGGWTAFAFGVYETPAWHGQLRLNGNISWTDYNNREINQTILPAPGLSLLREHLGGPLGGQLRGQIGANFRRDVGQRLTSENVVLLRLRGQNFTSRLAASGNIQTFAARDDRGEAVVRSLLRYTLSVVALEAGLEGAHNWLDTTSSFLFNAIAIPLPNARASVSETRGEASAKVTWKLNENIQLEGGLRLEASTIASQADARRQTSLFYPKPRLALIYSPSQKDQFRFRIEREVGQLDFNNFVAASALDTGAIRVGNTGIFPQQAWTAEAAYERRFWEGGVASLTYRHSLISDAIDRIPVRDPAGMTATFDAPGNIGAGLQDVLVGALTFPLDRFGLDHAQIKAAATLQWSRVTDPTTRLKRAISDLNPAEYSINFRQDLPRWKAAWGVSLVTPCAASAALKGCGKYQYRFNEIDVYRADPALGLFVEYQPRPSRSLRFDASNILGQRYERDVNIYGGPRDVFPLSYTDRRRLTSSPSFKIGLREAF